MSSKEQTTMLDKAKRYFSDLYFGDDKTVVKTDGARYISNLSAFATQAVKEERARIADELRSIRLAFDDGGLLNDYIDKLRNTK